MIFDTGSTICMIGKNHLQQIGMAPPTGAPTNKVKAVGGVVDAWEVPAQIALGRIVRTVDLVVIEQLRNPLLGQSFYGDLKYEVDNARGQIAFKKPGGKGDFVQAGSIDIPLTVEGSNLIVTAKVNGRPMPFYFDTSAGASRGRVMRTNTVNGRAPRSMAASSRLRSNWPMRARITMAA